MSAATDTEIFHGSIKIKIAEARKLRNADKMAPGKAGDILSKVFRRLSDPYVTVRIGANRLVKTRRYNNTLHPKWNEFYEIPIACIGERLEVSVKDHDTTSETDHIGYVWFGLEELKDGKVREGWFQLLQEDGSQEEGQINMEIQFLSIDQESKLPTIPHVYFPPRTGCNVVLYHDAKVSASQVQRLQAFDLQLNAAYTDRSCWDDLHDAIQGARHVIYVAGWAVYDKVVLRRDEHGDGVSVGEMLKQKADEGVKVCIMVWDDPSSRGGLCYTTDGLMGVHDEESKEFFKHSKVKFVKATRSYKWTHHQKFVVLDAACEPEHEDARHIVAFVGGLDLTEGRYDDGDHCLFSTLQGVHRKDFSNHCFPVNPLIGPRQPWHDCHCKLEGAAARDVMINFEERWRKQTGVIHHHHLVDISKIPDMVLRKEAQKTGAEEWTVQLLRSIDGRSAEMGKHEQEGLNTSHLNHKKGRYIDDSIQRGYVHQIRRAQRFIYLESQYFIGSCHAWSEHQDTEATQLVPLEIALKICQKIRGNEPFAVYVVIPIYPEGDPASAPIQEILYWQFCTIRMMTSMIQKCITEVGSSKKVSDYLNFFCPVNREVEAGTNVPSTESSSTINTVLQETRRFMIYVHSKMMIVDDEYVIIGSANLNQRSMDATRDTEICMGAFQNEYLFSEGRLPRGQVYGFRMALFNEHLGCLREEFRDPSSQDCVEAVHAICERNADVFLAKEPCDMDAHLIRYPYQPDQNGVLKSCEGFEVIPDTNASFFGCDSLALPNVITT